jgi:carboxymethylenebutenolidase
MSDEAGMGEKIRLTNPQDNFALDAWRAPVSDARRGGLVVLHAIWGVTPHIRELCEGYAAEGYETIAPSLFDRFERGFPEKDIDPSIQPLRESYAQRSGYGEACVGDIQAAIDALKPPVFLLGFCFGGSAAWVAAAKCDGLSAVSCFYGGHIVQHLAMTPKVPTILHFGRTDPLIPPKDVEAVSAAHPDLPLHIYEAGHSFVAPSGYVADAARLARLRTLQLFARNTGVRAEM